MTRFPTTPSLAVATEAYQVLLELNRQHKGDPDLEAALADAWVVLVGVWNEEVGSRL